MSDPASTPPPGEGGWFDRPANQRKIQLALVVACVLTFVAEPFVEKHPHFGVDGWFGFFAVFGFVAYSLIVLSAKQLRRLTRRPEDYYDA